MKAKLVIEGKEFPIEIQNPELQKLVSTPKKTGYERVGLGKSYFYTYEDDRVVCSTDSDDSIEKELYHLANYYSDETVAENNARADRLMRQLRRFAVERRKQDIDWYNLDMHKYIIGFNYKNQDFFINYCCAIRYFGLPLFDSEEAAQRAIKTFHDELIWYFTQYKDSL